MKKTQMVQLIAFLLFLSCFSFQTETQAIDETSTIEQEAQMPGFAEFSQDAVASAFESLQKIDNRLTEIALLVKKGYFSKYASTTTIMDVITENRSLLNELLKNQAAVMSLNDPEKHLEIALILSEISNAFISYLTKQIYTNFKKAKAFNLDSFLTQLNQAKTRNGSDHNEPAYLLKRLNASQKKMTFLDSTVQNIGLTWYNKAARNLDAYVVTPANKWHVPTIAMYSGLVGTLGLYSLWHYGKHFSENENVPEFIRDFVKDSLLADNKGPLNRDRMGDVYIVGGDDDSGSRESRHGNIPKNASTLAVLDLAVTDFMSNQHPLAAMGAGYTITSAFKSLKEELYPKIERKIEDYWNFLRGGEYTNTYRPGITQMKPTVTFDDMVGLDEVKRAFYAILQYIDNPEQLMRIEATPEKGWLLTGPSRTGKSFSVECLCGEIERMMAKRGMANTMKFFNINATLVNQFGIKDILHEVYENAPAVIFLDEIDLLGLQRVGNNQMLSEFLTAMQSSMNADPSKVVIIIAATNNPENLDKALRQNGRFGKEIRFDYPSKKYRIKFLTRELTNMALNINDFDIETLANKTSNKTFEDLKRIIRNAMTRSWLHGISLTQELLEESIDTELHNIMMHSDKDLPENELRIIATHFAGAAIAAMHLETHEQLDKITIHSRMVEIQEESAIANALQIKQPDQKKSEQKKIEYGALLTKKANDTINAKDAKIIINEVMVLLAGFAAEELLLGPCGFTCHEQDSRKAYQMLEDLIFGGLDPAQLPKSIREELKIKAYNLHKQHYSNVMELLKEHQDALVAVADELIKKQILNNKEIQTLIDRAEGRIAAAAEDNDDDIFALDDFDDDNAGNTDNGVNTEDASVEQDNSSVAEEPNLFDAIETEDTEDNADDVIPTTFTDIEATEVPNSFPSHDEPVEFLNNAPVDNETSPIKTYMVQIGNVISKTAAKCNQFVVDQQKSLKELIHTGYIKVMTYLSTYVSTSTDEDNEFIEFKNFDEEVAFDNDIEAQIE